MEKLKKAIDNFRRSLGETIIAFSNFAKGFAEAILNAAKLQGAPNSRIKHLALYNKKARVRKKNYKRLLRGIK